MSRQYLQTSFFFAARGWGHIQLNEYNVKDLAANPALQKIVTLNEINFFSSQKAFLKLEGAGAVPDYDLEYGPYILNQVVAEDYVPVSYEDFFRIIEEAISEMESISLNYKNIEINEQFIRTLIAGNLKQYIQPSMKLYRLLPYQDMSAGKIVRTNVWEYFLSFIAIEENRKKVLVIDMGRD